MATSADELITRHGRFIDLTTASENANQLDTLIESFDVATGQWLEFWQLEPAAVVGWRVRAYLIDDEARFRQAGLIPDNVPEFPFGYTLDDRVWVRIQPSEYYTRHLLLHEGAHALAFQIFGGAGPTWYMEGTAEMLATHTGTGANILINQLPTSRGQVPYWGRFKRIGELREADQIPPLETVLKYQPALLDNVTPYSLSWAAAMLFYHYDEYRDAFQTAARGGRETGPTFNRRFYQRLRQDWPAIRARWRLLCHELDYGFQWDRERVALSTDDPLWDGQPLTLQVEADRGWQSTGVRFPPGTRVQLNPEGEVVLDTEPRPWISQPAGVTLRYHRGRPLGQLLVCVLPNATPDTGNLTPLAITPLTETRELAIAQFSWLLFRINDGVGELGNNEGVYRVTIDP